MLQTVKYRTLYSSNSFSAKYKKVKQNFKKLESEIWLLWRNLFLRTGNTGFRLG